MTCNICYDHDITMSLKCCRNEICNTCYDSLGKCPYDRTIFNKEIDNIKSNEIYEHYINNLDDTVNNEPDDDLQVLFFVYHFNDIDKIILSRILKEFLDLYNKNIIQLPDNINDFSYSLVRDISLCITLKNNELDILSNQTQLFFIRPFQIILMKDINMMLFCPDNHQTMQNIFSENGLTDGRIKRFFLQYLFLSFNDARL